MIYLDNAATTRLDEDVINIMTNLIKNNYGNASSTYKYGREAKKIIEDARKTIALCINAKPEEIIFTSGGSESDNYAIKGVMANVEGGEIAISAIEHHAVTNTAIALKNSQIKYIPVTNEGIVEIETVLENINYNTKMISIMLVNNEVGTIQNIKDLVAAVHKKNPNCIFHTDAVQAIGHIPVDVKELGIDLLSASAHKFNGPKGIGFLYAKEGIDLFPLINGGEQERGKRAGTENIISIAGMATALSNNIKQLDDNRKHILQLKEYLLECLKQQHVKYTLNSPQKYAIESCINICIDSVDAEGLLNVLDINEIYVSLGSACNSKEKERSHVLKAMGVSDNKIDSSLRITIGKYNTMQEMETVADVISKYYKLCCYGN